MFGRVLMTGDHIESPDDCQKMKALYEVKNHMKTQFIQINIPLSIGNVKVSQMSNPKSDAINNSAGPEV